MRIKNQYEILRDTLKENSLIVLRNMIYNEAQSVCHKLNLNYHHGFGGSIFCISYGEDIITMGIFDINSDSVGIAWGGNFEFKINLVDCDDFDEVKRRIETKIIDLCEIIDMKKQKQLKK